LSIFRDHRLQLDDIIEAVGRVRTYTQGMSYDAFAEDEKTQDAVIRNLEIVGEAARGLPSEMKQRVSSVQWKKITELRNLLIHEYFGVSLPIIWDVIENKLGDIETACRQLLDDE
jgi:uncharacterized protein with HEPN domain